MVPWTIEHRVFAYDSYVKNNESVTAVGREFRHHFNIHQIRQSYVGLKHLAHEVHYRIGDRRGPHEQYVHRKKWNVSDKLCCGVPINLLGGIALNLASVIDQ